MSNKKSAESCHSSRGSHTVGVESIKFCLGTDKSHFRYLTYKSSIMEAAEMYRTVILILAVFSISEAFRLRARYPCP